MIEIRCERCGKKVGQEILDCPERSSGNCPYLLRRDHPNPSAGWVALLLGWMFMLVPPGIPLGLLILMVGVYLAFGERVTLYDPATGMMWQRSRLGSVEVERVISTEMESLTIPLKLDWGLSFPPSITALRIDGVSRWPSEWDKDATAALAASITVLIARDLIQVGRMKLFKSTFGGTLREFTRGGSSLHHTARRFLSPFMSAKARQSFDEVQQWIREGNYLLLPGSNTAEVETVDGMLENRILEVVYQWKGQSAAGDLPLAPTIYDLVRALVKPSVEPSDDFARQVQNDAAKRDLCTVHGLPALKRRIKPNPTYISKMQEESKLVHDLMKELAQLQPDFVRRLYADISFALSSRTIHMETT
jgi:hypothetical protein